MPIFDPHLASKLEHQLTQTRRRKLVQQGILCLPLSLITLAIMLLWTQSWFISGGLALVTLGLSLIALSRTQAYTRINLSAMLFHYNRQFPELEESAQLLLLQPSSLLQDLQAQKVAARLAQLIAQRHPQLLPHYSIQRGLLRALATAILLLTICFVDLSQFIPGQQPAFSPPASTDMAPLRLLSSTVSVSAPAYTKLALREVSELDLRVISGSTVTWRFTFADPQRNYYIQFADGERQALSQQPDGSFTLVKVISQPQIYSLGSEEQSLEGVFTLAVTADEKPTMRFITPQATVSEYPKNVQPEFSAELEIDDDFGLSKVEIIASVAKGSGESVKFRDQTFSFDKTTIVEGKAHYFVSWRLAELGMEPGDELYFSVKALDNREPQPQQSRSPTKIIRWLEQELTPVLGDSILIDFMPEYFKSQRQLIIETEQLLAEQNILPAAQFDQTSNLLGHAQRDLKEKYGQYLGDEVDDGGGGHEMHEMEAGAEFKADEAEHEAHEEHTDSKDKSGFSHLIEQYGHAHGDVEVGIITKLSPVGLMKRAIATMWQAELHLMLSQPQLALPFEQEALRFLNQAKQAERIYVKRLGFEPPPVSEKRRYQGDLSDILSYQRIEKISLKEDKSQDVRLILQGLKQLLNQPSADKSHAIDDKLKGLIGPVKQQLLELTGAQPELIEYVAILQRMQQQPSLYLADCEDCLSRLVTQLWQLLPPSVASPTTKDASYLYQDSALLDYAQFLRQAQEVRP